MAFNVEKLAIATILEKQHLTEKDLNKDESSRCCLEKYVNFYSLSTSLEAIKCSLSNCSEIAKAFFAVAVNLLFL